MSESETAPAEENAPAPDHEAPAAPAALVPFRMFAMRMAKTQDEVFTLLMRHRFGSEKNSFGGWTAKLDALRNEPTSHR